MANGIGWDEQLAGVKDPERRARAIESSPVYRETPLSRAKASHGWQEPIGAAINFLNPTRVVTTPSAKTTPNDFGREGIARPTATAVQEAPSAPAQQAVNTARGQSGQQTTTTTYMEASKPASPADAALAEYNRFMGKSDGGIGDAMVARGFMNKYQALKPFDQNQQAMDDAKSRHQQQLDLEKQKMEQDRALKERELNSPGSQARERLYGAQASVAEGAAEREKQRNSLLMRMQDPKSSPEDRSAAQDYYMKFFGGKQADSAERAAYIQQGLDPDTKQAFAVGGAVEAYASGGQIPAYGAAPQPQNPLLAQYGQYLGAAKQTGVAPVPFVQYVNLLASTRAQPQQMIGFADGGDVPAPAQFATGGAIPVAGKELVGPGTGTSDSIPAVIDGKRPAALSSGEFVIPAHVVRAKGTEFFDKLIAQYADDKGQGNG